MIIPDKVKIGGKTYTVEITKNLYLGSSGTCAELIDSDCEIHIVPMSQGAMEESFLHELIHGVFYFLGYEKHKEAEVERLAQALYMVIQDNPEIFKEEPKNV